MVKQLSEVLEGAVSVGIAGHVKPDGDCVGSCLSVYNYIQKIYPQAKPEIFLEPIPNIFKFLKNAEQINSEYPAHEEFDLFIALDCGDKNRLGKAADYFEHAKETICIDHHVSNDSFAKENVVFPDASSTCEIVYELMDKTQIDEKIAECIYTGMVHDTGVFQYSCTSAKTMNIAGELMDKGIAFTKIIDETFYEKTYEQNRILGQALIDSKIYFGGKIISTVVTAEQMKAYHVFPKHLEGIVSQLRATKGVDAALFLYENADHSWKASMRSNEIVDCAAIAVQFGGGGHVRAAGATIEGDVEEILKNVLEEMKKQLKAAKKQEQN